MKRRAITILFLCMAISVAGCGDTKPQADTESGTEMLEEAATGAQPGASAASVDISYDAKDYVKLGDYSNMEVTLNEADYEVTDDAVNNYVDQSISYTQPYMADESKTVIQAGDVVDVNYVGKKDGVAFEGGSAENQIIDVSANTNVATGTGYIEGFTDGLIGTKVGETVDCEATFPENYQSEELKGQKVTFTFTVNSIGRAITREDIDDAYVKENFQAENLDDFYKNVRETLNIQAENGKKSDIRSAVLEKLMETCEVTSFPEGLLEARLEEFVDSFREYYCSGDVELADFLQSNYGMTEEQFRAENQTYLETNLTQELILETIAEKENIAFDQDEYDEYISNVMSNGGYPSKEDLYGSLGSDQEAGEKYFRKVYLANKACDMLADQAKVTYTKADDTAKPEAGTEEDAAR